MLIWHIISFSLFLFPIFFASLNLPSWKTRTDWPATAVESGVILIELIFYQLFLSLSSKLNLKELIGFSIICLLFHPIPYSLSTHPPLSWRTRTDWQATPVESDFILINLGSHSYHMSSLLMLLFTVVPIFFFPLYSPSWRTRTDWRTTVESDVNLRSIQRPLRRSASQRPPRPKISF